MSSAADDPSSNAHCHETQRQRTPEAEAEAEAILQRGLQELLRLTEGMEFQTLPSERYPLPLTLVAYKKVPAPETIRREIETRMQDDPLSVLENALALLELYESNQQDISEYALDDGSFLSTCFASKRCNGWISVVGGANREELEQAINANWQFRFFSGPARPTGVYALLNLLARYAFVYGKTRSGDAHRSAHFIEEHSPGLLVCRGSMNDLELTLSLAAMKMGLPAVVPRDYPFSLGRTIRADSSQEISEAVVGFANIRRLLKTPNIPDLPDYCQLENQSENVPPDVIWGDTPESFYIVRKGNVASAGIKVVGQPHGPIGVVVTIDAEPMDAVDRTYIEREIVNFLSMMRGVAVQYTDEKFRLLQSAGINLDSRRIGEVLIAAVRKEFPKINNVGVEVIFDRGRLVKMAPGVRKEKEARLREIEAATEETSEEFYACVGCSPFAPDHMCVITPERPPQCGRPFETIKTGALYGYDDMSNIHHSALHRNFNSFLIIDKGRCLEAIRGEWEGANAAIRKFTGGRTCRVQLHAIDQAPHTGCSCFRMIMFQTDKPRPGIGIMEAGYEGNAPDGRSWKDLHYALTGKQTPGMAGAAPNYLLSGKFLQGHGGWSSVVWVSPKIANIAGAALPDDVAVGK